MEIKPKTPQPHICNYFKAPDIANLNPAPQRIHIHTL